MAMKRHSPTGNPLVVCSYSGTSVKAREYALECVLQVGGVLLTTYDMVRCNSKALRGDFIGRDGYGDTSDDIVTWDYIILDEVCACTDLWF
jgi:hypothetical protein